MSSSRAFALFLSTLSLRRATSPAGTDCRTGQFLSTLSLRRATSCCRCAAGLFRYFYPRSPCGERLSAWVKLRAFRSYFYPRSPCGERRHASTLRYGCTRFLSTLSLRRATVVLFVHFCDITISIHALLAESDGFGAAAGPAACNFYPRSPCGERLCRRCCYPTAGYFYPRSPCGERLSPEVQPVFSYGFLSTLSLRRATFALRVCVAFTQFLSTLSLRRATATARHVFSVDHISIHALLAESDCQTAWPGCLPGYFYPRSPCGERPEKARIMRAEVYFYPRSPCGERRKRRKVTGGYDRFLSTLCRILFRR